MRHGIEEMLRTREPLVFKPTQRTTLRIPVGSQRISIILNFVLDGRCWQVRVTVK
jgi:hypothetical protein